MLELKLYYDSEDTRNDIQQEIEIFKGLGWGLVNYKINENKEVKLKHELTFTKGSE